jgi:hypothetical protein
MDAYFIKCPINCTANNASVNSLVSNIKIDFVKSVSIVHCLYLKNGV